MKIVSFFKNMVLPYPPSSLLLLKVAPAKVDNSSKLFASTILIPVLPQEKTLRRAFFDDLILRRILEAGYKGW